MVKLLYSFTAVKLLKKDHVYLLLLFFTVQIIVPLTSALPANGISKSLENLGYQTNSIHTEENQIVRTSGQKLTLYLWNNHQGRPATIKWSAKELLSGQKCKEVPHRLWGKARSVNTHDNCFVLYSKKKCVGAFKTLKVGSPSHNRLKDIAFQNKAKSARPCTEAEKGTATMNRANYKHVALVQRLLK